MTVAAKALAFGVFGTVNRMRRIDAGVRGAILVDEDPDGRALAYFVDYRTNAYALDVAERFMIMNTPRSEVSHAMFNNHPGALVGVGNDSRSCDVRIIWRHHRRICRALSRNHRVVDFGTRRIA